MVGNTCSWVFTIPFAVHLGHRPRSRANRAAGCGRPVESPPRAASRYLTSAAALEGRSLPQAERAVPLPGPVRREGHPFTAGKRGRRTSGLHGRGCPSQNNAGSPCSGRRGDHPRTPRCCAAGGTRGCGGSDRFSRTPQSSAKTFAPARATGAPSDWAVAGVRLKTMKPALRRVRPRFRRARRDRGRDWRQKVLAQVFFS